MTKILDVDDCEIENIKDKEILLKELEHTNNNIELYHTFLDRISLIILSWIAVMFGFILQSIFALMQKQKETMEQVFILSPFGSSVFYVLGFIFILIFFRIISIKSKQYDKILERKKLILKQLKKIQDNKS